MISGLGAIRLGLGDGLGTAWGRPLEYWLTTDRDYSEHSMLRKAIIDAPWRVTSYNSKENRTSKNIL